MAPEIKDRMLNLRTVMEMTNLSRTTIWRRAREGKVAMMPKYAPELNDIEIVWGQLKANHLAHQTFADPDALERAIHAAVSLLNAERSRHPLGRQRISA